MTSFKTMRLIPKAKSIVLCCRGRFVAKVTSVLQFNPYNFLGTDRFTKGRVYTLSTNAQKRFNNNQPHLFYGFSLNESPEPSIYKMTQTQASLCGCVFDTFFPKIHQPALLQDKFDTPAEKFMTNIDFRLKMHVGHLFFIIGVDTQRISQACVLTPKMILESGSITKSAFPPNFPFPPKMWMQHAYAQFRLSMEYHKAQTESITGWVLYKAFVYAQQVRRFYNTKQIPEHLVDFKIVCVAFAILQQLFRFSRKFYQLLIHSFCYSVSRRRTWVFLHKATGIQRIHSEKNRSSQKWGFVQSSPICQKTIQELDIACEERMVAHSSDNTKYSAWIYACPFQVFQRNIDTPKIRFGPSFKLR